MAKNKLTLTLDIIFEEVSNMDFIETDLRYAIQSRLFCNGVFDHKTLVDNYTVKIETSLSDKETN